MLMCTASALSSNPGRGADPHVAPTRLLEGPGQLFNLLAPLLSLQGACRAGEGSSLW